MERSISGKSLLRKNSNIWRSYYINKGVHTHTHAWLCAAVRAARQFANFEGILMYILHTCNIFNVSIITKMPYQRHLSRESL